MLNFMYNPSFIYPRNIKTIEQKLEKNTRYDLWTRLAYEVKARVALIDFLELHHTIQGV